MGNEFAAKSYEGGGAIYIGMGITKVSGGIIQDRYIPDGTDTYSGLILSSNNYEGGIRDIMILPRRARKRKNL